MLKKHISSQLGGQPTITIINNILRIKGLMCQSDLEKLLHAFVCKLYLLINQTAAAGSERFLSSPEVSTLASCPLNTLFRKTAVGL